MNNPEQTAKELIKGCAKMEEGERYVYSMCGRLNNPVKPIRYYCPNCKSKISQARKDFSCLGLLFIVIAIYIHHKIPRSKKKSKYYNFNNDY